MKLLTGFNRVSASLWAACNLQLLQPMHRQGKTSCGIVIDPMGYSHCMSLSLYIVVLSNITQTWAHCPARELLWGRHRAANNCPGLTDSEMAEGTPMDWKPPNDLASEVCHFRLNTKAGTELKSKWLASELLPSRLTSKVMLWTCFFTFTWLSMFKANTVPNERDKRMAMTSSSS